MCSVRLGVGIYLTAWPCVSLRWVFFPWNFSLGLYVVHRSECGSVSDICVRRRYYADLCKLKVFAPPWWLSSHLHH
ncbi:hypothetical protein SCP_1103290 [Sparassis crispa]|uniref:Uncharacterized protein n=1 Tax=Sparassis crispa TaxID=139825 RepID=A0A401GZS2_9APHY|nr:hypothetical protein SCP_1103290 [Sparassis crispa]GBE87652.1 hypothetical protein SCP_1103290 [Sparassis crispa]